MKFTALFVLLMAAVANSPSTRVEEAVRSYDAVECVDEYHACFRRMFEGLNEGELTEFLACDHDAIATMAAWQRVKLTIPLAPGDAMYVPDTELLSWFVGFFEGRNRVTMPDWWRKVVMGTRAHHRANIFSSENWRQWPYQVVDGMAISTPIGAEIHDEDMVLTYTVGADSIVVPEGIIQRSDSGGLWDNVSGAFTEKHFFVASYSDCGYPHRVACIDRESGNVRWISEASGCYLGDTTGVHMAHVSFVVTNDERVFIFGAAATGFHAQGFDVRDGSTLMQFSSGS